MSIWKYDFNCATAIIGKKLSSTGHVLIAHNEDDGGHNVVRHAFVPEADHPEGSLIPAEEGLARLPQVSHTLGYYWAEYIGDKGGLTAADSFFNTCGVLITSNSMSGSRENDKDSSVVKDGGIGYALRRILAERSHSAREGASILMKLMEEWGYAPSGRAYTIADKDEAFMFQLVRGHHYIGARVPDDAAVFMPNHYTFHTLTDCPEMFFPEDIAAYAVQKGWYLPKDPLHPENGFDFALAYQTPEMVMHPANIYRQKHAHRMLLGRDWNLEKEGCPFLIWPDQKVNEECLAEIMTSHYEGTEDDLDRNGPGLSPHTCPDHRRICAGTTLESVIWEFEEDVKKTCAFTAFGRPCQVPFLPLHPLCGLPEELKEPVSPALMMETHLEAHPGVTAVSGNLRDRFRRLCGLEELLHKDVFESVSGLRHQIFREALELHKSMVSENAADHQTVSERDRFFLLRALSEAEKLTETFQKISVLSVSPEILSGKTISDRKDSFGGKEVSSVLTVTFCCEEEPVEETLVFGLEYTSVPKAFGTICPGSLTADDKKSGIYRADFMADPILPMLPFGGKHTFWLGGNDRSGRAFAGSIDLDVKQEMAFMTVLHG